MGPPTGAQIQGKSVKSLGDGSPRSSVASEHGPNLLVHSLMKVGRCSCNGTTSYLVHCCQVDPPSIQIQPSMTSNYVSLSFSSSIEGLGGMSEGGLVSVPAIFRAGCGNVGSHGRWGERGMRSMVWVLVHTRERGGLV
ncbi:hypothetical protein Salat_2514200 [Sesamum alatum]|uniref:Uncharacterized protein n=1 Tax=Sesamum alatum TaxID=300844 RepID=A0AAE1XRW9_9LAMI|nr:hypothetical protein Salat_2514200 [Sesamum alatum]